MAEPKKLKKEANELKKAAEYLEETAEQQESDEKPAMQNAEETVKEKTGYKANEILKAPVEPPKPEAKDKVKPGQVRNIIIGFALAAAALLAWPILGFRVALAIAIVGAVFISIGAIVSV